jgi:aminocarboxymuconate-semialdehyde decarboxylase
MESAGVDLQVLSASPQLPNSMDEAGCVAASRFVNDQYADVIRKYPTSFRAFASLPLPHLDAAHAEMARCLDELGMIGVTSTTSVLGRALTEPHFAPLFEELDRREAVLFLHPVGNGACTPLIADHHATWMVGAPVEDTISVAHLIIAGIPLRYPGIRIINSHLGGAVPMLLQRMDNMYRWEAPETPELPSTSAKRMWYDTVAHGHVPALRCACESFGAGQLLLGTDFPAEAGNVFRRAVTYVAEAGLPAGEVDAILSTNAATVLGLAPPTTGTIQ